LLRSLQLVNCLILSLCALEHFFQLFKSLSCFEKLKAKVDGIKWSCFILPPAVKSRHWNSSQTTQFGEIAHLSEDQQFIHRVTFNFKLYGLAAFCHVIHAFIVYLISSSAKCFSGEVKH